MRYAVVREELQVTPLHRNTYNFSKWHDTKDLAVEEAERLCRKEGKEFIILCEVGRIRLQSNPVVYEEIQ